MRKIIGYFFIGGGGIVLLFFRNYHSHIIPWPWMWWLFGLGMSAGGSYIITADLKLKKNRKNNNARKKIEEFKRAAEQKKIDVNDCIVLSGYNKIIDKEELSNSASAMTNFVIDYIDDEPAPDEDVECSVVVYTVKLQGKERKFVSQRIAKNPETLEFLLGNKKEIDLYIDKYDPSKYYFDLDFLYE